MRILATVVLMYSAILLCSDLWAPYTRAETSKHASLSRQLRAYVTNFAGGGVTVLDPVKGQKIAVIATGSKPHGVGVAPDGKAVYVSNEGDGTLSIIDPKTNRVTTTIPVGKRPNQLEVSVDGRHVFVTLHGANALAVIDVAARRVVKRVSIGRTPHIVKRSPDGKTIYVTSEGDMKLVSLDAKTWSMKGQIPLFAWPRVLAISNDGLRAYQTIRWLNGALVVDLRKRKVVDRLTLGAPHFAPQGKDAHGLAFTPNGRELWLTTQTTNDVTVFNAITHQILKRIQVGVDPNWVEFSPDGRIAVVSNTGSNNVSIINVSTRKVTATISVGRSPKRLVVAKVQTLAKSKTTTIHFDKDKLGTPPKHFSTARTGRGKPGIWKVLKSTASANKGRVLAQLHSDRTSYRFPICVYQKFSTKNVDVSVKFKPISGKVDQAAGLVWRYRNKNNYYVVRANALENNVVMYKVHRGQRSDLPLLGKGRTYGMKVKVLSHQWSTLRVTAKGNLFTVYLNGKKLYQVVDRTFSKAGKIGVWTKADSVTHFDDLQFRALP